MTSIDEAIESRVAAALEAAIAPYIERLTQPPKLTLTVPEAAAYIGVPRATAYRWVKDGTLPVLPHNEDGDTRVPRAACERLVAEAIEARKSA